ncbi:MAG: MFS transporter [Sedimentibacter saalensis]|uniref:MFS transporter n=1 Tax=Sedimentibacter saalensis TaxID=130788 RepID=UPI002B208A1C|nr:MFS transporter [Sedimentibacter saalensis]MEA5093646.1 MFS transporter [Sedimentibacter saalensis]
MERYIYRPKSDFALLNLNKILRSKVMKQLYKIKELRSFLILWGSQAVSSFGTAMTNFALIIWAYKQQGTVSSITLLSVCSYLPSILFCFLAGTLADRWNKKKIMLICDFIAALGTLTVFILYSTGSLRICHLYVINFTLSFMNAFQNPATYVAGITYYSKGAFYTSKRVASFL